MSGRPVLELLLGDVVRLRRAHPCGSHEWLVDRLGADIGLRCRGCDRHVLLERRALESRLVAFLRNRSFLLLWLSQVATQIGGNMVLYGLTVVVLEATDLSTAVSGLFL